MSTILADDRTPSMSRIAPDRAATIIFSRLASRRLISLAAWSCCSCHEHAAAIMQLVSGRKAAAFLIGMHGILITIYLPSSNDRLMSSELFSVLSRRTSLYSKESASVIADNLFADMRRYILHLLFDYL